MGRPTIRRVSSTADMTSAKGLVHAVWLFGSRARGESRSQESDVDVLVLVDDAAWDGRMRVRRMLDDAARELGLEALTWSFSIRVPGAVGRAGGQPPASQRSAF